jgi:hypothetical protein
VSDKPKPVKCVCGGEPFVSNDQFHTQVICRANHCWWAPARRIEGDAIRIWNEGMARLGGETLPEPDPLPALPSGKFWDPTAFKVCTSWRIRGFRIVKETWRERSRVIK